MHIHTHEINDPKFGEVAEWSKAADCKSAGASLRRFESCPPHAKYYGVNTHDECNNIWAVDCFTLFSAGVAQLARASAFQAEGRGFESRLPLQSNIAHVAQSVEHILGKDEVSGSSPLVGSIGPRNTMCIQNKEVVIDVKGAI